MKVKLKNGASREFTVSDLRAGDFFTLHHNPEVVNIATRRNAQDAGWHYLCFDGDHCGEAWDMDDSKVTKLTTNQLEFED